jgi:hypothetical protein
VEEAYEYCMDPEYRIDPIIDVVSALRRYAGGCIHEERWTELTKDGSML